MIVCDVSASERARARKGHPADSSSIWRAAAECLANCALLAAELALRRPVVLANDSLAEPGGVCAAALKPKRLHAHLKLAVRQQRCASCMRADGRSSGTDRAD